MSAPQGRLPDRANSWELRTRTLHFGRCPSVMGIINVTPDSFSDGGQLADAAAAVDHALRLVEAGAAILDVGGESTRPYAEPVSEEEELSRVTPVLEQLVRLTDIPISIDTSKAAVARRALDIGVEIVNDVTGLQGDPAMFTVVERAQPGVCVMHMQGTPQTMQESPTYRDVVGEVHEYLQRRFVELSANGIAAKKICVDPGIGFGKTHQHNLTLLAECWKFHDLGCPVLVGHSRKGFIKKLVGEDLASRMSGTIGVALALATQGVQLVRVHDVAEVVAALRLFDAAGGIGGQAAELP